MSKVTIIGIDLAKHAFACTVPVTTDPPVS